MWGRKTSPHELKPPPDALSDDRAREILRTWIVGGGLQVSLTAAFDDPATWGLALVDIARHVARIYAREGAMSEEEALARVCFMWRAELESPTDLGQTERTDH